MTFVEFWITLPRLLQVILGGFFMFLGIYPIYALIWLYTLKSDQNLNQNYKRFIELLVEYKQQQEEQLEMINKTITMILLEQIKQEQEKEK